MIPGVCTVIQNTSSHGQYPYRLKPGLRRIHVELRAPYTTYVGLRWFLLETRETRLTARSVYGFTFEKTWSGGAFSMTLGYLGEVWEIFANFSLRTASLSRVRERYRMITGDLGVCAGDNQHADYL